MKDDPKEVDILFVVPPSRQGVYQELSEFAAIEPPVWACLLARRLMVEGFNVVILDAEAQGLTCYECSERIRQINPKLAAFSIYGHQPSASTQCMPATKEVAELVRIYAPNIPLLAFGTHPSALPVMTLYEGFDYVIEGEGLYALIVLLHNMKTIRKPGGVFSLPGLWHVEGAPPPKQSLITDLDRELPGQAWGLLNMARYRPLYWHKWTADSLGFGYASVQTSLGCPFRCAFCCINAPFGGPSYRTWSPQFVADQLEILVCKYGIRNVKIPDEMFVLNPKHVASICNEILARGRLGDMLNMWAYARVDTVRDEALLALMRKAGFRWLGIGVESASKHVRDGIEKGRFGNEEIVSAIRGVQKEGLHVGANYIFGLPDDTLESMNETLDLACEINAEHANFYCAMAYPGSALHKIAEEKGWALPESSGRGWLGYSQHSYECLPLETETLSSEEVLDFRDKAFLHYHSRPEHLSMLQQTFGAQAVNDIQRIVARGMPKRKHRDPLPDFLKDIPFDEEDLF